MYEAEQHLAIEVIGFAVSAVIAWLIMRSAVAAGVAAALRIVVVEQNDLIVKQLTEQTRLLGIIAAGRHAPDQHDHDDDLPPPPAARLSRS